MRTIIRKWHKWLIVVLAVAVLAPLVACGQKSAPIQPPESDHPRKYPTR